MNPQITFFFIFLKGRNDRAITNQSSYCYRFQAKVKQIPNSIQTEYLLFAPATIHVIMFVPIMDYSSGYNTSKFVLSKGTSYLRIHLH